MQLDLTNLFVIPLAILLGGLFLVAFAYDWITFRRRKSKNKTIYQCSGCRHIYSEILRVPLARCPKCGTQNAPRQR